VVKLLLKRKTKKKTTKTMMDERYSLRKAKKSLDVITSERALWAEKQ
jgi:hypothetical protein